MLLFLYETIYQTGYVFFPLFFLGLLGWVIVLDFIYFNTNLQKKKSLLEKINSNFQKIYLNKNLSNAALIKGKRSLTNHFFSGYESNLKTIKVITITTPLLGLLGTVSGMIKTFSLISLYGNGNPSFITDGISEALLTTQAGITIAFPLLLAYNYCQKKLKDIKKRIS